MPQNSCGVNTARFLKYVWSFFMIMHKKDKTTLGIEKCHWTNSGF